MSEERLDHVAQGVVYDFGAWLTTRDETIVASRTHNAAPMAEACKEFLEMRGVDTSCEPLFAWESRCGSAELTPILRVTTASGSVYEFSEGMTHVRRMPNRASHRPYSASLRKDGEWVVLDHATIEHGEPMRMLLFGLEDGVKETVRVTTPVVSIEGVQ